MNQSFNMEEFIKKDEPAVTPEEPVAVETQEEEPAEAPELDVQKAVVEALAADKAELDHQLAAAKQEIEALKGDLARQEAELKRQQEELARKESELAARMEKELDLQERNPNALALLDREIEVPDRFPGETRDHVLEVVAAARAQAEAEGRLRRAQVLEAVLMANEPNGTLAKRRAELDKLFAENANVINGPVLDKLRELGISHKNGEEYLLPGEIMKRSY